MPTPRRGYPSDLTDAQWALIESMLPEPNTDGRPEKHPRREIVNAILYVVRAGCPWRYLPSDLPPWQTVYWYFVRWEDAGVTEKLLAALRVKVRTEAGRAAQGFAGRLVDWARDILKTTIEIVRKPADQRGFAVNPRRWVVERTLAWLTACRRLARDYERVPEVSEAIIRWAAIAGMARRITRGELARRQNRRTFIWT